MTIEQLTNEFATMKTIVSVLFALVLLAIIGLAVFIFLSDNDVRKLKKENDLLRELINELHGHNNTTNTYVNDLFEILNGSIQVMKAELKETGELVKDLQKDKDDYLDE